MPYTQFCITSIQKLAIIIATLSQDFQGIEEQTVGNCNHALHQQFQSILPYIF